MNSDPSNRNVPIPEDQVTWQMRANAIGSPDNIHPGAFKPEAAPGQISDPSVESMGATVTSSLVEVDEPSVQAAQSSEFADVWSNEPFDEQAAVEAAAVRPEARKKSEVVIKTRQQMAINAADRQNRKNAGLPPRTFDLR